MVFKSNKGKLFVGNNLLSKTNSWHNEIIYISQSPFIFNDTIQKNVSLDFEKKVNLKKLKLALQKAEIFNEVNKLPKKLNLFYKKKVLICQAVKIKELP